MSTRREDLASEASLSAAAEKDSSQAKVEKSAPGDSWREGPGKQESSNATYHDERHIFNGQERRTGLRKHDRHASWKEVRRACGVGGGGHE